MSFFLFERGFRPYVDHRWSTGGSKDMDSNLISLQAVFLLECVFFFPLTKPRRDFIQLCKSPKKKNNLIKASISFYSRLSPNLTALETIQYRPLCAFRWLPSCPIHPLSLPRVFSLLLCLFINWGPPKTTTKFVILFFCPLIRH